MRQFIQKIKTFLFPDDHKLKVECTTDFAYNKETKKLTTHRRFYTLRSLLTFFADTYVRIPIRNVCDNLRENPLQVAYLLPLLLMSISQASKEASLLGFSIVGGSIAYDASTSGAANSDSLTISHTTSGDNRVLVVTGVFFRSGNTASYAGTSMTKVVEDTYNVHSPIYVLSNPTSGANNCVLSMASSSQIAGGCVSFSGANTSSPIGARYASYVNNTSISSSIPIQQANSITVELQYKNSSTGITQSSSQTERFDIDMGGDRFACGTKAHTAAGVTSLGFSGSGLTGVVKHSVVEVKEYGTTNLSIDSSSKSSFGSSTVTSVSFTHNIPADSTDRLLLVFFVSKDEGETISAITYNGDAMTFLDNKETLYGSSVKVYYLVNPDTGTNSVSINCSDAYAGAFAVSLCNVDTSDPIGAYAKASDNDLVTCSTTTECDKSMLIGCASTNNVGSRTMTLGTGQILLQENAISSYYTRCKLDFKNAATSGSFSETFDVSDYTSAFSIEIVAKGMRVTTKTISDTGSGSDSVSEIISGKITDSGSATETASIRSQVQTSDIGQGSELITAILAQIIIEETATSTDNIAAQLKGIAISVIDTGAGTETINAFKKIVISDTGLALDAIYILLELISLSDEASGSENIGISGRVVAVKDNGIAEEALNILTHVSVSDSAVAIDIVEIVADVVVSDSGSGVESLNKIITFNKLVSDIGSANENISFVKQLDISEAGTSQEALGILAHIIVEESGYGTEMISREGWKKIAKTVVTWRKAQKQSVSWTKRAKESAVWKKSAR